MAKEKAHWMNKRSSGGLRIIVLLVLLYLAFRQRPTDLNLECASSVTTLANRLDTYY